MNDNNGYDDTIIHCARSFTIAPLTYTC